MRKPHPQLLPDNLPPPENRVYFPSLDGFRAAALLLIFADHYGGIEIAGFGVNAFFVLSGFLITGILLDSTTRPNRVSVFYARRILRIFPLYYGVFLALFLATPFLHPHWTSAWLLWLLHLGNMLPFLPRWLPAPAWNAVIWGQFVFPPGHLLRLGHFWSLCVEEQFYLFWPLVVFHLSRRNLLRLCTAVVVALPFLRILSAHLLPIAMLQNQILLRILPFQADSLLLGGLLALLWRGSRRSTLLLWAVRLAGPTLLLAVWAAVVHYRTRLPLFHQPFATPIDLITWQVSVVNLSAAVIILAALQPASTIARVFSLAPLRWIGRISYGAYIFHDIPHQLYHHLGSRVPHSLLATTLIAFTITLALASLSYRFFERPFLRLKVRWS